MEGDVNTHYFHTTIIIHRRYNHIYTLLDTDNVSISDPIKIGDLFVSYYSNLFSSGMHSFPIDLQQLITPSISATVNAELLSNPPREEILQAMCSMHNSKSPGPDDMSPLFYKKFWSIVSCDVISAVQSFFTGGQLSKVVNHTFITLIPKREEANKVEQFQPIALCNVV